jgi:hypothetical protein
MFFNFFQKPKQLLPKDQKELLQIIAAIRSTLTPETAFIYSYFESVEKLERELDQLSLAVRAGELNCLEDLNMHFLPTSGFQELAIENGWSNEYLKLAQQFDHVYKRYN